MLGLALLGLEMLWLGMLLLAGSVMTWYVVFGSVVTRKTNNHYYFKRNPFLPFLLKYLILDMKYISAALLFSSIPRK